MSRVLGRTHPTRPGHARVAGPRAPWPAAVGGGLLGAALATLVHAPAQWGADALQWSSQGRVQLQASQGSLWQGSAVLVLHSGDGVTPQRRLPTPVHWRWQWQAGGPLLHLQSACCTPQGLRLHARWHDGGWTVQLADGVSHWPLHLLSAWGAPWQTLQAQGRLVLDSQGLGLRGHGGQWHWQGQLHATVLNLSSALSPLQPVGTYRLALHSDAPGGPALTLSTRQGPLLLQGQGDWSLGHFRFRGEARASAGQQGALDNLLNILGRRVGDRSLLSLG